MGGGALLRDLRKSCYVETFAVCAFGSVNLSIRLLRIRQSNNHYDYNHLDKEDSLPEF